MILVVPGLPLGWALFGRRHPAGWLAGVILGYAVITLAWWSVIVAGHRSFVFLALAWVIAAGLAWFAQRWCREPLVVLPTWTRTTTTALLLVLLMVPAIVGRPFARLGAEDASGGRQYRAYFIADFVWHMAVTAELAKHEPRPLNPFLSGQPLHYYWTYFRVPATVADQTSLGIAEVLKLNALFTALCLMAAIFLAAWAAVPDWPLTVALAVALTTLAASAEGLAGIADIIRRGLPLAELRDLNIDAIAAWAFKGLRIDNLPRTMWYTPQHGFSCALGLLSVPIALVAGARARPMAIALAGCALGASIAFNPLLGAVFCAVYGITVLVDTWTTRATIGALFMHAIAVVPVAAALAWCTWNQVGEGANAALHFGFWGLARNGTILGFLLQFGPLLIPMLLAFLPDTSLPWKACVAAAAGVVIAILVMHLLALTVDLAWVGFRGGNIFFVFAPALIARGLIVLSHRRPPLAVATVAVVLLSGLPTTVVDAYNTQDVENRHLSRDAERVRTGPVAFQPDAEFHWTLVLTKAECDALEWIRTMTPPQAIVQFEPAVRGRETWSLIPSFAERRMATGNALALLPTPAYAERNDRVRRIYASSDAREAWQDARNLGIDYLYVDATERSAYPAVSKFDSSPEYFSPAFRNAEAVVYAVRP